MPEPISEAAVQCSALLDTLVDRFKARAKLCRDLEATAVEETRWHDAATYKSHRMIWERAANMVNGVVQ